MICCTISSSISPCQTTPHTSIPVTLNHDLWHRYHKTWPWPFLPLVTKKLYVQQWMKIVFWCFDTHSFTYKSLLTFHTVYIQWKINFHTIVPYIIICYETCMIWLSSLARQCEQHFWFVKVDKKTYSTLIFHAFKRFTKILY